jgi:hypothetical protein
VAVARIDRRAGTCQAFDFARVASGRRGVQAAKGGYFSLARRNLRRSGSRQSEKYNQTQQGECKRSSHCCLNPASN